MLIACLCADAGRSRASRLPLQTQQHASSISQGRLAGSSSGVGWFVQLSDLHINKWVHPEILPDLAAFGQQVTLESTSKGAVFLKLLHPVILYPGGAVSFL
jgi:hypothetical protein